MDTVNIVHYTVLIRKPKKSKLEILEIQIQISKLFSNFFFKFPSFLQMVLCLYNRFYNGSMAGNIFSATFSLMSLVGS